MEVSPYFIFSEKVIDHGKVESVKSKVDSSIGLMPIRRDLRVNLSNSSLEPHVVDGILLFMNNG